jgi:myo-inositol-1(or 4)-monophosphatase
MEFWQQVLSFATLTAQRVGEELLQQFGQVSAVEKQDGSLVTHWDRWSDDYIRTAISSTFPHHGLLSEESDHCFPNQDWVWIIDPLDGTTNFAMGVPLWAISFGLFYQGTPVFGYVHVPPLSQSFHGFWGGTSGLTMPTGSFLNGQLLHTKDTLVTDNHLFSFCTRSICSLQQTWGRDRTFPCKIRMFGVATYNMLTVSTGSTLGAVEATPKIWDIGAVWSILHGAGATWIHLNHHPIFPLLPGVDYGNVSFPSLVLAHPNLTPIFLPWVDPVTTQPMAT